MSWEGGGVSTQSMSSSMSNIPYSIACHITVVVHQLLLVILGFRLFECTSSSELVQMSKDPLALLLHLGNNDSSLVLCRWPSSWGQQKAIDLELPGTFQDRLDELFPCISCDRLSRRPTCVGPAILRCIDVGHRQVTGCQCQDPPPIRSFINLSLSRFLHMYSRQEGHHSLDDS